MNKLINKGQRIYLAGPFFNNIQFDWAHQVAGMAREAGYTVFAPIEGGLVGEFTRSAAKSIFGRNEKQIHECDLVMAQIDWPMPEDQEIWCVDKIVRDDRNGGIPWGRFKFGPIHVPDSGTVWEIGMAYAIGKPIVAYTIGHAGKLNLMLEFACKGFLSGEQEIERFLKTGIPVDDQWRGQRT